MFRHNLKNLLDGRRESNLRKAIIQKDVEAVKLLLPQQFDSISELKYSLSLIKLALAQSHDANRTEILKLLMQASDFLPSDKMKYLLAPQLKPEILEMYDEKNEKFNRVDELTIKEQLASSQKDVVVHFFAEYDHQLESKNFGAIKLFYLDTPDTRNFYSSLKDFTIFRVTINDTQQMEPILIKINSFLPPTLKIQHLMIHAHANNEFMQLGENLENKYAFLYSDDVNKNNSAMKKTLAQMGVHGTVAFYGCTTALGAENITKKLSKDDVAQGRLIFGTSSLPAWVNFITIMHKGKKIPFLFFNGEEHERNVRIYKNAENIADCQWRQFTSRL